MPLYEYQCDACGHRFEVIQKFSDAPIETCEKCSGGVRKLLSSPAIQFKGTGWYITDYARAGKSDGAGGEGAGAGKSESGDKADKGDKDKEKAPAAAASPASTSSTSASSSTS
jgi:putative FmdB family regulatory protein